MKNQMDWIVSASFLVVALVVTFIWMSTKPTLQKAASPTVSNVKDPLTLPPVTVVYSSALPGASGAMGNMGGGGGGGGGGRGGGGFAKYGAGGGGGRPNGAGGPGGNGGRSSSGGGGRGPGGGGGRPPGPTSSPQGGAD